MNVERRRIEGSCYRCFVSTRFDSDKAPKGSLGFWVRNLPKTSGCRMFAARRWSRWVLRSLLVILIRDFKAPPNSTTYITVFLPLVTDIPSLHSTVMVASPTLDEHLKPEDDAQDPEDEDLNEDGPDDVAGDVAGAGG